MNLDVNLDAFVRHVLGIEARSRLYLRFDSSGTKNRDFKGKNVFHGFHGSIVDYTGLAQKQPISRACYTVIKFNVAHCFSLPARDVHCW